MSRFKISATNLRDNIKLYKPVILIGTTNQPGKTFVIVSTILRSSPDCVTDKYLTVAARASAFLGSKRCLC